MKHNLTHDIMTLFIAESSKSKSLSAFDEFLEDDELFEAVPDKKTEKFDHFLSEDLLYEGYGAKHFDVDGARKCVT